MLKPNVFYMNSYVICPQMLNIRIVNFVKIILYIIVTILIFTIEYIIREKFLFGDNALNNGLE